MELRWLISFVTVAEEMHFSRAARRLNLAQPALTAHIRQLESEVGAPLFLRSNRMSGLTAAGVALLPEARLILERTGRLAARARDAHNGGTGELRLGVIPPAATHALADALRAFAKTHPRIALSVQQGDQASLIDALANQELDLVIGRPVTRSSLSSKWIQQPLFAEEQGVVLREDDPLAPSSRLPLQALDGRTLLLLSGNPHFGQLLFSHATRHGVTLTPAACAHDFPSLHWMVRAGLGIAPCSLQLTDALPRGLRAVPLNPPPPPIKIRAIARSKALAPGADLFLKALAGASLSSGKSAGVR